MVKFKKGSFFYYYLEKIKIIVKRKREGNWGHVQFQKESEGIYAE